MMLADMEADVIRIEAPDHPDIIQSVSPFRDGVSAGQAFLNRNKRSIVLDLKNSEAQRIVKRLIRSHNIVIEQFRPGVMDRLGIGYESLAADDPGLIYCALTGFGQSGSLRDRAGHDINYLALSGIMSYSGRMEGGPVPHGVQVADVGAGSMFAVVGILAGVVHRLHSGRGQFIDVSMYDGSVFLNGLAAANYLTNKEIPGYENGMFNGGSVYDFYATQDGRYFSVGALEPKFWSQLCNAIGRPDLILRPDAQAPDMPAFKQEIRDIFASRPFSEWRAVFAEIDACVEPVLRLDEALSEPHCKTRGIVVDVPTPNGGYQPQLAFPIKFSEMTPRYDSIGCEPGEHTEDVLRAAGYSTTDIASFRDKGVFGRIE